MIKQIILEEYNRSEYLKWKKQNISLRGMKEVGKDNGVYGSLGKGLYSVPLSNKPMASKYGKVYFVLNGKPKNPKVFESLNDWEIFFQRLIKNKTGNDFGLTEFENTTTIEDELMDMGYDGILIKGREMVAYKPENVKYFETEQQLENYYYDAKQFGEI